MGSVAAEGIPGPGSVRGPVCRHRLRVVHRGPGHYMLPHPSKHLPNSLYYAQYYIPDIHKLKLQIQLEISRGIDCARDGRRGKY